MPYVFNVFTGKLDFTNPGSSFDPHSPGPIGDVTPSTGAFTTLSATPGNNATGLTITGGSITGSGTTPSLSITQTWNTTGIVNGIFANFTNTASHSDSNVINLQVGGTPVFRVGRDGVFRDGINASGNVSASNKVQAGGGVQLTGVTEIGHFGNGNMVQTDPTATNSNQMFLLGGTSSSFPAFRRNSTVMEVRLADNSAFTVLQANFRTTANAVAESIVPTHTVLIQDATGTSYKIAVQAA